MFVNTTKNENKKQNQNPIFYGFDIDGFFTSILQQKSRGFENV